MQVTKKNLSDTKVQLEVKADAATLTSIKEEVLQHVAKEMRLSGFRQGKAPLALVEKNANPATLQTEFLDKAINAVYGKAVDEQKLRPVSQPQVKIVKFVPFGTLELEFEMEVVGEIKLPDYKKTKKAKKVVKITAKDIDAVLDQLRTREAEKKDVDRAAKTGDQVWIDFTGVDVKTKEPIKGADGKDYPLILGSKTFIPGFEEELTGLKKDDKKTFVITFPKDYGVPSLQERKVEFAITVNKVMEVVEPKLDDAFAAKVGPFKSVDALKDDIKTQLKSEKQYQADREYADELLREITAKAKAAIPAILVEEQVERIITDLKQNLLYRAQTWKEYLEEQGVTEQEYRNKQRAEAELRVKAGLVLGEIAEQEKVRVTPEELEIRIQLLKGQYPDAKMQEELNKPESRREIASRMVSEKTMEKITSYASAK